jgi:hypothetical protein
MKDRQHHHFRILFIDVREFWARFVRPLWGGRG